MQAFGNKTPTVFIHLHTIVGSTSFEEIEVLVGWKGVKINM